MQQDSRIFKEFNVMVIASHGGHLTEAMMIINNTFLKECNIVIVTYENKRVEKISFNKYLFKNFNENKLAFIKALIKSVKILAENKIDLIISTGSEIAIPFFLTGKIFNILRLRKIKLIFVESMARVYSPSRTSQIIQFFTDALIVQFPYLFNKYLMRKKIKYIGNILGTS